MHTPPRSRLFSISAALLLSVGALAPSASAQMWSQFKEALPMMQRGVVVGVEGKMGPVAIDPLTRRTIFAAPRSGSVEVLDAMGMSTAQSIKNLNEPQNLLFLAEPRKLLVSCSDGKVLVFGAAKDGTLTQEKAVAFDGEADFMVQDPKSSRIWVGHGWFLSSFDLTSDDKSKPLALNAAPEQMAIEKNGNRLFVNVARKGRVVVVDRDKGEIADTWQLKDATGNNAMAFDEANARLFIATRNPAKMIVLDAKDGREITRVDIAQDVDSLQYDARGARLYAIGGGGGGKITLIRQDNPDTYLVETNVNTAAGTSTSLLLPEQRRLLAVAPKLAENPAFVFTYLIPDRNDRIPGATPPAAAPQPKK